MPSPIYTDVYAERERRRAVTYLYAVTATDASGNTDHYLTTAECSDAAESRVARHCAPCTVGYSTLICGADRDVQPRRVL
jgi:hypothetical protein